MADLHSDTRRHSTAGTTPGLNLVAPGRPIPAGACRSGPWCGGGGDGQRGAGRGWRRGWPGFGPGGDSGDDGEQHGGGETPRPASQFRTGPRCREGAGSRAQGRGGGAKRFGTFVHCGYGAAWGAFRGVLGAVGLPGDAAASAAHLAAVWGAEQVMLPALGVSPPITQWGATDIAVDAWHHVVYAVAGCASVACSRAGACHDDHAPGLAHLDGYRIAREWMLAEADLAIDAGTLTPPQAARRIADTLTGLPASTAADPRTRRQ